MPNPAIDRACSFAAMFAAVVMGCTGCAPIEAAAQTSMPTPVTQEPFTDLVVEGSLGHRFEILTQPGVYDRASAVLTYENQIWRVSDDCPAFGLLIQEYQRLPAVRLGPSLLLPEGFRTIQLPGRRMDGESWTIKTTLYGPDASAMRAELRVINGPYAAWADNVVRVIKACGPSSAA